MEKFIEYIGLSNFIGLDLETTGLDSKNDKIIEISAYKFNNGVPVESFTYLINPEQQISSITTQITGIDYLMVKDKPVFKDIEIEFVSFIGEYPIVGHNIIFDMNFLKVYLSDYESIFRNRMICDTFYLSKIYYYYYNSFSLASLCQKSGIQVLKSHRAEEDAKNSGLLFMKILEKIKGSNLILMQKLKLCIGSFNVPNNQLFDNVLKYIIEYNDSIDTIVNSYSHAAASFVHENKNSDDPSIEKIFEKDGLIEKKSKDYELRSEQVQFSKDILNALYGKYSLVVEAGAGLGKSYAYLFSSLLYGKKNQEQVVISTNTHSLQNQLFHKDIPFVIDVLNQDCRATIVKGINNYICLTRLEEVLNDISKKLNQHEAMELLSLFLWIQNTKSGDISECASFNYKYYNHLWLLINARSEFCLTYKCNRYNGCYYRHIKKQAKKSDILIVNHSMMVSYQDKQDNFISDDAICIIDECHNFPSICQKQSSKSVSTKKIKEYKDSYLRIIKSLDKNKKNKFKIQNKNLLEIIGDVIDAFQSFSDNFYSLNVSNQIKSEYIQNISINRDNIFPSNDASAQNYLVGLNKLILEIRDYRSILYNDKESISKNTLQEFDFLLSSFEDLYLISDIIINNTDNSINWFSYRYTHNYLDNFSFNLAPENLQDITHNIFGSFRSTIFCSATLSTSTDFDFFIRQMGFNDLVYQDKIKLNRYPSPYYYSDQTKLFILNTEAEVDSESHIKKVASDIFDIHLKANKRILVLCTSFKQIYDFERAIHSLATDNNRFLFQKKGVSRDLLLSDYLQYSNSVLFGTNTFWEGIDLPKDKLEILIIFKLPFSNPKDPFIKANIDYYNSNNLDAFSQYQLQDAIIKLKQGFGRLIRGYDDMGICIITDPRLTKRKYGKYVIDSFPIEPIYYSSPSIITYEIEKFFN